MSGFGSVPTLKCEQLGSLPASFALGQSRPGVRGSPCGSIQIFRPSPTHFTQRGEGEKTASGLREPATVEPARWGRSGLRQKPLLRIELK